MEFLGWKAYYTDDRVFSNSGTSWTELPNSGVLGIVLYYNEPYREILYGGDWYYLEGKIPSHTDAHEEWGKWIDPPDVPSDELKRGEAISDEKFSNILDAMMGDKSWP